MVKIALISDTHQFHDEIHIPTVDILIHAGDYSSYGNIQELVDFNRWLGTIEVEHKIIVSGNHDSYSFKNYQNTKNLFTNATYIQDELITIMGLNIWGSPWSRTFGRWAFMTEEAELLKKYNCIPEGTDIVVSHTPMYGYLDNVPGKGKTGSHALAQEVCERIKPRLLVCGHLHDDGGRLMQTPNKILVANAAICDEDYVPSRKPIVIDL